MSKAIIVGAVLSTAAQFASANILNPSFELTPPGLYSYNQGGNIAGWVVGTGDVEVVNLWQAAVGNQCLDLNGNNPGAVYQDVSTSAGQSYTLRFAMAGNPDGGPAVRSMDVVWRSGNSLLSEVVSFDMTGKTPQNMGWVYHEFLVQAGSDTATLSFASQVGYVYGPALDDVSLVPIPEPSAAAGALLVALVPRRARRRVAR